jgi:predicted RNase H-like nuclease (RuvC/YqgF family)
MTDPVVASAVATIVTAVVTYTIAPLIQRAVNREKTVAEVSVATETSAVSALRSALDGLQEENSRLHEAVARQDARIQTLNAYVTQLEDRLRHHRPGMP